MRISQLSERAGLPVGTVKFYVRSGLLHSGIATSATQAIYDESHLARLRMIRALFEVGGLSLADIQRIIAALEGPPEGLDARVEQALADSAHGAEETGSEDLATARALLADLGWQVSPDSPHLPFLASALAALESVGLRPDRSLLRTYADAAARVARQDLDTLQHAPEATRASTVAAATVLLDPLMAALRRLAREDQGTAERARVPGPRVSVSNPMEAAP